MSLNIQQKEQNSGRKNNQKQIPAGKPSSGKQYPFYQMTLNWKHNKSITKIDFYKSILFILAVFHISKNKSVLINK